MFQNIKNRLLKPVIFNDLKSVKPISEIFGLERGKPIDRYYIEKFISSNKDYIKGTLMEIGDDEYSKMFFNKNVEKIEILHTDKECKNATIIGDLTDISHLPENAIDCFICTQTFNFIYDFKDAIKGAYKVLKPGGVILSTLAGVCQISRYDMDRWGDYWRFTSASAQKAFGEVFGEDNVEVEIFGNVLSAIALLQGICCEDLKGYELLDENDSNYQVIVGVVATKR